MSIINKLIFIPFLNLVPLFLLYNRGKQKFDLIYFLINLAVIILVFAFGENKQLTNVGAFFWFVSIIVFYVRNSSLDEIVKRQQEQLQEESRKQNELAENKRREEEYKKYVEYVNATFPDFANDILEKKLKIGMPLPVVECIFGEAENKKESVNKTKTTIKYNFLPYQNQQNKTSYKLEVTFEDDIVVGWKDIN